MRKTVPIRRPPVARKRKSRARKESRILLIIVAVGGDLTAGSQRESNVRSALVEY